MLVAALAAMVRRATFRNVCSVLCKFIAGFVTLASIFIDPHGGRTRKPLRHMALIRARSAEALDACPKGLFF